MIRPQTTPLDEILDTFEMLGDWEERYVYILELGDELPEMDPRLKTEQFRVQGCTSNVWMLAEVKPGDPPALYLIADSDSQIVRGLIAILMSVYSGHAPEEILAADVDTLFDRLGLKHHLSRSRSNGLRAMVKRVRALAKSQLDDAA